MIHEFASALPNWLSQTIAIVLGAMVLGTPFALWRSGRWMRTHVAEPLQEVPVIRATQLAMQDQLHVMDIKVDKHIAEDKVALESISLAVEGVAAAQATGSEGAT